MKIYSENQDYQALVANLEKTKNAFDTAKSVAKEVKGIFKTTKKDAESKANVFTTQIQYRQAKLKQKVEKLAVRGAELNLTAFVHDFKETHKQDVAAAPNMSDNKKVKSKKKAGNSPLDTHNEAQEGEIVLKLSSKKGKRAES